MTSVKYDVIVVGIGSMGAATCYNLASRGAKVLGLEQYSVVHENGSHAGHSRMVRKAYFEHPDYVPLLDKSYKLWAELEQKTNHKLYHETGLLYAGPPQNDVLEGVKLSAQKYRVPLTKVDDNSFSKQFPAFTPKKNYEYLYEPNAGYVVPEVVINIYKQLAISKGAKIIENQRVDHWIDNGNNITVTTQDATYIAGKIIFTAGAYMGNLISFPKTQLIPRRQIICWFEPKNPKLFRSQNFPCFLYITPELPGAFYGFPLLDFGAQNGKKGIKVGYHHPGEAIDPYNLHNFDLEKESGLIKEFMKAHIPDGYKSVLSVKSCLYTYTDDGHFIIENQKEHKNVSVACGFSGHGFKFVPLVGEILADLSLEGKTKYPIEFLSSDRFV